MNMTLPVFLTFVTSFGACSSPASAQTVHAGVTAGWAEATLRADGASEADSWKGTRSGRSAGLMARLGLPGPFAIQVEVLAVEKGFGERDRGTRLHLHYIEVPILLVGSVPLRWRRIAPELFAGVAPARERSCDYREVPGIPGGQEPAVASPLPCTLWRNRRADLGAVAGGGVSVEFGALSVMLSARHTRGLTDIGTGHDFVAVRNRTVVYAVGGMVSLWSRAP